MKRPKGVKYKPLRSRRCKMSNGTMPPADKCGPYVNALEQGGPPARHFHYHKRVLLRDFKDGLDNQDKMNDY